MAGQAIGFPNGQGHTRDLAVYRSISNAPQILAERSRDDPHGANRHVMEVEIEDHQCAKEHLRNTRLRLNKSSRFATVAELYASIAHQLSQPLTSMLSNAQAARRWLAAEPPNLMEAIVSLDRIARCAHAADETLERIRALFGQEPVDKKEASAPDLMNQALMRLVQEEPHKREIPIDWYFDEDLPKVFVDPLPIQEVFINLISNAIEAMEGNSTPPLVRILATVTGKNEMLVQVIDNGPGVRDAEKIFDAFVTTKDKGMGIGLTVSRLIVEAHGGRLWAENMPSGGAKFSVALPLFSVHTDPNEA
jgi:C4-dicarboxylate-specific signal transduction histidine kinase